MCGIAGWIRYGESLLPNDTVRVAMKELEGRGRDASGTAWFMEWGQGIGYRKADVKGSLLWSEKQVEESERTKRCWNQLARARGVFLHTRATTKGDEKNIANNHPVIRPDGKYAVIHNGMVTNDDAIFEHFHEERSAEVDTEAIALLLDRGNTPEESIKNLTLAVGSYAIAGVPRKNVDHVIFFRNSSTFAWVYEPERKIFFFASTPYILKEMVCHGHQEKICEEFGFDQPVLPLVRELKDDHYMVLGPEGLGLYGEQRPDHANAPRSNHHPLALRSGRDMGSTTTLNTVGVDNINGYTAGTYFRLQTAAGFIPPKEA